jgi:hypothetical protein
MTAAKNNIKKGDKGIREKVAMTHRPIPQYPLDPPSE